MGAKQEQPSPAPRDDPDDDLFELPRGLDSGDVVLFNRRCMSMSPAGAGLCAMSKFWSNSAWDHVGLVVKHPDTGELLFLEADFGGVKLRSLHERIRRSRSHEIAIRRLDAVNVRTDAMRRSLFLFAQEMLGRAYDLPTGSVMASVTNVQQKIERQHYTKILDDRRLQLEEIEAELKTGALTSLQVRYLQNEYKRVEKNKKFVESHLAMLAGKEPPRNLNRVFCSALVAAAYQRVGLFESYPPADSYLPKNFSTEASNPPGMHLLKKARLGKEFYFRASANRMAAERAKELSGDSDGSSVLGNSAQQVKLRGVAEGEPPSRDSRRIIRDVLKRTPLYKTVPDEYKKSHFIKSFKAQILEPGDVIFNQGDYGNDLFIIESGKVERFVGKGNDPPIKVRTLGPRNSFGLTGFSFTSKRGATIRASERTLLWTVDRPTYERFRDSSVDTANHLSGPDRRYLRGLLQKHFLFSRLERLGPREVAAFFPVTFRAGEQIFGQGDAGDNFYIIVSGEAERHIRHPKSGNARGGDENSLAETLGPGQSFGELSLMYNEPRGATMRARTDLTCYAIDNEHFHKLNVGSGTQFLKKRFEKSASVERGGTLYMTPDDFLDNFANVDDFEANDRERLSSLLVSLVTSNRERDPLKATQGRRTPRGKAESEQERRRNEREDESLLMDFWEFVRFDIVLNQPMPETAFAFRLADQDNTGFISLDEMQYLLALYADIDETADRIQSDELPILSSVFGRDGSKQISLQQFQTIADSILPPLFKEDIRRIAEHMRNIDIQNDDADFLADLLIEDDGSPSIIGSHFVQRSPGQSSIPADSVAKFPLAHMICTTASAFLSRTAVAPLERLKILMQTSDATKYRGIWSGFKTMIREDTSITHALFRGNGTNLLRIVPTAAIHLAVLTNLRRLASSAETSAADKESLRSRLNDKVLIAGSAGLVAGLAMYPLEYARGRLSVQRAGFEPYAGAVDALRQSVRKDGMRSVYRGITPSVLGVFPYVGFSFGLFEAVRPILPKRKDDPNVTSASATVVAGAVVSGAAQLVAYPLDTCRRRMQVAGFGEAAAPANVSFLETVRGIFRTSGVGGFYRGAIPNFLKVAPMTTVSFFAYDYIRKAYDELDAMSVRTLGRQA